MGSSRYSILNVTFLLALFIMTSDLAMMKTEARGPIYRLPCENDKQCQVGCHNPNCGCASVCINQVCQCPPFSTYTDTIKPLHHAKPPPTSNHATPRPNHATPPPPPPPHHATPPPRSNHATPQPCHSTLPPPPHHATTPPPPPPQPSSN